MALPLVTVFGLHFVLFKVILPFIVDLPSCPGRFSCLVIRCSTILLTCSSIMASLEAVSPKPVSKAPSVSITAVEPPTPPVSPPLPNPRTISELISQRAKQLPNEYILGYPAREMYYGEFTFAQLERFSTKAARDYAAQLPVRVCSQQEEQVVALLGPSNLDYVVTTLALTRLGFTVLFLSTRLSEAAYASLLNATKCRHMFVDTAFQRTATALESSIADLHVLDIVRDSAYRTAPPETAHDGLPTSLHPEEETNKTCWIIHSSGSTGLPKPIYQTHHAALRNYEQNMNMRGFITLPLFHAYGLSSVFRAITSVKKMYLYNANLPLTSQNLLANMRQHKFEIFYGVPYALKLLSESKESVEALAAMKVVMFGGSACPDALGDQLVEGGVNLISHYGTTETGQLMTSFRPVGDNAWNYVRVHKKLEPYVRWENRGADLYELVVLSGWPSKVATNRHDGSYATKDLFGLHPSIKDAWKYSGRLDDTLVLTNGEKAIPIAMEQAVRRINLIREAIMFGAERVSSA